VTGASPAEISVESVGEKWGASITTKALRGLFVFLILTILYMSWRLEPKMAAAGIVALLHDLIITAGVYAIVGFEVSPATVIATLTILGFSLYDTIVVFDKIQENEASPANSKRRFSEIVNEATNQVLMRSFSTSLTVLLPVGSLLFIGSALLGAETLKDLALALFVGVTVGAYSSIFLGPPLLSVWKEKEPRYAALRSRAVRQKAAATSVPEELDDEGYDEESAEEEEEIQEPVARSTARTATAPRSQPRKNQSRAKRKGKK
jgi:preprotein translocase subunit SecF